MAKGKFSGEVAKKILIALAGLTGVAALTVTLAVMPGMGLVAKEFLEWYKSQKSKKREYIRRTFVEMRRDRLIVNKQSPDGAAIVALSRKGQNVLFRRNLDDIVIARPQVWDGQWRFVIFDFPQRYHKEREYFRNKLKQFGFHQLQKSVWLHPFPCDEEIVQIAEYLGLEAHIRLLEVTQFDGSEEIHKLFF